MLAISIPSLHELLTLFPLDVTQGEKHSPHRHSLPKNLEHVNVENWPPVGISPHKLSCDTLKLERKFRETNEGGMTPVKSLFDKSSFSKLLILDNSLGIAPERLFVLKSNTMRFPSFPNSGQTGPLSRLLLKSIDGGKLWTFLYCIPLTVSLRYTKNGKFGLGDCWREAFRDINDFICVMLFGISLASELFDRSK
ncbi:hypothetical protein QJS10_CPA03g02535 [Acorus calamus]|uniref:Uncharacterized protein n=1 Tax=Acorus calamus TaxID=4465 RepID=A0AAV9F5J9_ACOCL|nr:hypothetical protein QJS10_CPA03g02535 [Acorus calamus]